MSIKKKGKEINTSSLYGLFRLFKTWGLDRDYIFCYDTPKNLLKEKNKEYKAGRVKASDDYFLQVNMSRKILTESGFLVLEKDGYEADHFVIYAKDMLVDYYDKVYIVTNDKDLAVCIDDKTSWISTRSKQKDITKSNYEEELGCPYNAIRIKKALVGDASDNLKGVYGFGEKAFIDFVIEEELDYKNAYGREIEIINSTTLLDENQKLEALNDLSFILPLDVGEVNLTIPLKDKDRMLEYIESLEMKSLYNVFKGD